MTSINRAHDLGHRGEIAAATYYQERGYRVIARNVRYDVGEIDLIVNDDDGTVVFVEVKTRSSFAFGGAEAVTHTKLRRMRLAAQRWLNNQPYVPVRFDVVVLSPGHRDNDGFHIDHYEGVEYGAR